MANSLKVVSLNCYLLPPNPLLNFLPGAPTGQSTTDNHLRIDDICEKILENDYDIVCLQEVWTREYKEHFVEKLESCYKQHRYVTSGHAGSGQLLFSKLPILSSNFYPFLLEDFLYPFGSIDSLCGKGCTVAVVRHNSSILAVVNTHPQSEILTDPKDSVRLHQILSVVRLVNQFKQLVDAVIICGDFNAAPGFAGIGMIETMASAKDLFKISKTKSETTFTYGQDNNLVEPIYVKYYNNEGTRIDYIFVVLGSNSNQCKTIECPEFRIRPWGSLGEKSKLSYSDHEAIDATINWTSDVDRGDTSLNRDLKTTGADHEKVVLNEVTGMFEQALQEALEKCHRCLISMAVACIIALTSLLFITASVIHVIAFDALHLTFAVSLLIVSCVVLFYAAYFYHYFKCAANAHNQALIVIKEENENNKSIL